MTQRDQRETSERQSIDTSKCLLANAEPIIEAVGAQAVARRPDIDLNGCPLCEGNAHIPIWRDGYRYSKPCPGAYMDRRIDLFNRARIPARYAEADITNFVPRDAAHAAIIEGLFTWVAGFEPGDRGRVWAGPVGTGKTHLMVACLRRFTLEKGLGCRYVEFSHLLGELRKLYGEGRSEAEILSPLASIPVLAIDELGKGRSTDFEMRIIDELITRRYNDASVSTLFATNYYPTAHRGGPKGDDGRVTLADRIGARSESRIYELCDFIFLEGSDYRRETYRES